MRESTEDWRQRAACRDADPELFVPEVATSQAVRDTIGAFCMSCPVIRECRTFARTAVVHGIWGGEWHGDEPRQPGVAECQWCGDPVESERSTTRYCGATCRQAAHRAREAASA